MRTEAAAPPALIARTTELAGSPVDLVAAAGSDGFLFSRDGHGIAGRGEALRVDLPRGLAAGASTVTEALARIQVVDDVGAPGTGAVAVGALPFDRHAPAAMVVPEVVVGRSADGRQWITTIGAAGARAAANEATSWRAPAGPIARLPDGFSLTSPRPHREWKATIAAAIAAIETGELAKVVVARDVVVDANRPIVVPDVLDRLRALYPSCTVFASDGFIGASPELLVERLGSSVRSHPLAGTHPRSGDPEADARLSADLLSSAKEQREHRFVIDDLRLALSPLCASLTIPDGPTILPLRNVLHLGTEVAGQLREPAPSALDLAALLHPTAAVGGTPSAAALAWLAHHERLDRGRYAGPVGWVDARGDGIFAVGIRSAEVDGCRARLFAGVGVVEGSDPERELIETQLKLQALLAAVVRP